MHEGLIDSDFEKVASKKREYDISANTRTGIWKWIWIGKEN
jgi:hypothetical protein